MHNDSCEMCNGGKSAEELIEWQEEMLRKHGWYSHVVSDDPNTPFGLNFHTHGFEFLSCPNIQIVIPLPHHVLQSIAKNVYERILNGVKFTEKVKYSRILQAFDVTFVKTEESGRPVLRMILPCPAGELDLEKMTDNAYKKQWNV